MKRSNKTKLPAGPRGRPRYRSKEIRPPSTIPRPPGVNDRAPSRKERIETVTIRFNERLISRAKATSLRRITSRTQTPQDRRRTGTKDLLNCIQFFFTFIRKEASFARENQIATAAERKIKRKR